MNYIAGKVTIITVYYNREYAVKESLESLINQSYENYEIIVVNDGSTDSTLDEINKFSHIENLSVIDKNNTGFVDSIYEAIECSDAEYIAIHGSGDVSLKDRLIKQVDILNKYQNVGVVGVHCQVINEITNKVSELNSYNGLYKKPNKMLRDGNFITQGEIMFRRAFYDLAGKYNKIFKYSQDYDLWLRMSHYCDFYIISEVLYQRYSRKDGVSGSIGKVIQQQYLVCFAKYCDNKGLRKPNPLDLIFVHGDTNFKKRIIRLYLKGLYCGLNEEDYNILSLTLKKEFGVIFKTFFMTIMKFKIRK